jgi:hypothetical protein
MSNLDDDIKKTRSHLTKIDKSYADDIAKLRKEKAPSEKILEAESAWGGERQLDEYTLSLLLSHKLEIRAEELDVPLPARPVYDKGNPDWDENEHWYRSPMDGTFVLTQRGREYVDEVIWKKEERRHNRWARYVTLGIGLIGAMTGLVSVTAANWDKLASMFGRVWQSIHP